ncbi:unnamed protein product [Heligmosomoides polygyrus]|uniref:Transposase n=1 Tax=Heligmosomoides polygyrus TaxID=6339 RepID=A0A183FE38_HELPZ|nr:unnamed protein product [Heligmosomoides polygyrus]
MKRPAKIAAVKAKYAARHENENGPQGNKFGIRLARTRHRARLNDGMVKTLSRAFTKIVKSLSRVVRQLDGPGMQASGSIVGQQIYTPGTPCTACTAGSICTATEGLCTLP